MVAHRDIEPDPGQTPLSNRGLEICDVLSRSGFATVEELGARLGVSTATIRRELTRLEETGKVLRTHGGARIAQMPGWTLPQAVRTTIHKREKIAIARAIGDMIAEKECVMIDAGTTMLEVARVLAGRKDLSFVTVGLGTANVLENEQVDRFVLIGGDFCPHNQSFSGPLARDALRRIRSDSALLSTAGIDLERGVTTMADLDVAATQRTIIEGARRVIIGADHTKFTSSAYAVVTPLDQIDTIVTGSSIDDETAARIESFGVKLVRAQEAP